MPETIALGTASRLSSTDPAPPPWIPFKNITCQEGDCLILSSVSWGAVNNVYWNGVPFKIGPISAGIADACIVYCFVTALTAGTADVVVGGNTLAANVALRKVVGIAAPDVVSARGGDSYGNSPSSPAVQTHYSNEFLIGVMGGQFQSKYFQRGVWQQGWTAGQFEGTSEFVLDEGFKIATTPELSQAQILGQTAVNYWMCHMSFRCCK